jgi:hypothetical protein
MITLCLLLGGETLRKTPIGAYGVGWSVNKVDSMGLGGPQKSTFD